MNGSLQKEGKPHATIGENLRILRSINKETVDELTANQLTIIKLMKPTLTRILVGVFFLIVTVSVKLSAQDINVALSNPVIMKYYTPEQITELAQVDSNGLKAIIYYFTASYSVEPIRCFDCLPFDSAAFDISRYEHLRLADTIYTREFGKYGFKLTLYPINALPYQYEIHEVPHLDPAENKQGN